MDSNIEVRIASDPWSDSVGVLISERGLDGKMAVVLPTTLVFQKKNEFDLVEPSFRIPRQMATKLFMSLAEALDKEGIKTDSDAKIAGTLEATREHLKDLQKIVFNDDVTHIVSPDQTIEQLFNAGYGLRYKEKK